MLQKISPLIKPNGLAELVKRKEIVLVDARTGVNAKEKYLQEHLKGALPIDLDTQLADVKQEAANGGRHPLPKVGSFAKTVEQLGISPQSHVIVYDDKNGSNAAARFWWMMKAIGHDKIQVLDGGMQAAIAAGIPVNAKEELALQSGSYKVNEWQLPLAAIDEIEAATRNNHYLIIDVRDAVRYRGENEPIDLVAGHIPNAVNVPLTGNLDAEGFFLSPEALRNKYAEVMKGKKAEQVIVHCGSGVTACHTLLAMDYAGLPIPKLYVGSWSEWSRNDKKMVLKN